MDIKRLWTLFAMALVIVMAFSLFACTPDEQESESESVSEESESDSQSESEESSSLEESSDECEHSEVYYEDTGDGKKCKKICVACEKVLSTGNHSKGKPIPEENCNIRCTKCDAVVQENKHTRGNPDPYDNCNVKCALCSAMLLEAMHPTPAEDALWILDSEYPQRERTSCSNCGSGVYRDATTNHEGLTILGPDFLWDCKKNDRGVVGVEEDENGIKYYNVESKTNGPTTEITVLINDGKVNLTGVGKYVAMLVRCESERDISFDFWINKAGRQGAGEGTSAAVCITQTLVCDGEWRILIFDFSDCDYIDPANGIGWVRFDINNPVVGDVIDIGFMGFFSSKREISNYYDSYLDVYLGSDNCTHISDGEQIASSTTIGMLVTHCINCNAELDPTVCEHTDFARLDKIEAVGSNGLVSFKADCYACGMMNAELRSLNPDMNKNFTAAELMAIAKRQAEANLEGNGGFGRYSATLLSDEAYGNMPYVKFTAKRAMECCLLLNDGSIAIDGQYLGKYVAILYRKPESTVSPAMQFLYTKNGSTSAGGYASGMGETTNDGKWRLMIIDLSGNTAINLEDGIGWTRLDVLDPRANSQLAAGDEIDIAFISFFDSKESADNYYAEYLKAYIGIGNCTHSYDGEWQGTGNVGEMKNTCVVCNAEVIEACAHVSDENWVHNDFLLPGKVQSNCAICNAVMEKDCEHVADESQWIPTGNQFEYKSVCTVCSSEVLYICNHPQNEIEFTANEGEYHLTCTFCGHDRIATDETGDGLQLYAPGVLKDCADNFTSNVNGKYSAEILTDSAKNNMPYTRITLSENTPKETFLWLCESGEEKLGRVGAYFMIVYRMSSACPTGVEVFASVTDGFMTADNGKRADLIADGEWHYAIFNFSNVKGWKGTEALQQLRIDIFNTADVPAGEYFDIAMAGFFHSTASAIGQYNMIAEKYGIEANDFYAHFDTTSCLADGNMYPIKGSGKESVPMIADLANVALQNAKSLTLGGWCLTPGGVQSINYRVISVDGAESELKKLCDGKKCVQAMVDRAAAANCYFEAGSVNGGNFQGKQVIDLSGYEGSTVTVEIVVVNNNGAEMVIAILSNVSVPAAN